MVFSFNWRFFA